MPARLITLSVLAGESKRVSTSVTVQDPSGPDYALPSRMCAGVHLANRELYIAFSKILYFFEVRFCRHSAARGNGRDLT
jgi:hypothetical protein